MGHLLCLAAGLFTVVFRERTSTTEDTKGDIFNQLVFTLSGLIKLPERRGGEMCDSFTDRVIEGDVADGFSFPRFKRCTDGGMDLHRCPLGWLLKGTGKHNQRRWSPD